MMQKKAMGLTPELAKYHKPEVGWPTENFCGVHLYFLFSFFLETLRSIVQESVRHFTLNLLLYIL